MTDSLVHAGNPVFSPKGDYLYFTASINAGPSRVGLDLSNLPRVMDGELDRLIDTLITTDQADRLSALMDD